MSYPSQPGDWNQQPGGWTDPAGPTQPFPQPDQYGAPPQSGPPGAPPLPPAGPMAPGYPAYGYPGPIAPPNNSLALTSMILSLVGIATCICAPIGAIMGHVALRQLRERGEGGEAMAKTGIIVGWIVTGLFLLLIAFYVIVIVLAISSASTGSTGTGSTGGGY